MSLDRGCRDQILFTLIQNLLRNYCVPTCFVVCSGHKNELRHDSLQEHILSGKAGTYVILSILYIRALIEVYRSWQGGCWRR